MNFSISEVVLVPIPIRRFLSPLQNGLKNNSETTQSPAEDDAGGRSTKDRKPNRLISCQGTRCRKKSGVILPAASPNKPPITMPVRAAVVTVIKNVFGSHGVAE